MEHNMNGLLCPQLVKMDGVGNLTLIAEEKLNITIPPNDIENESRIIPEVSPASAPSFLVTANPLLPPEYKEVLDYNGLQYMNGFLRTQIGQYCQIEFLVGNTIVVKAGNLIGVGLNHILLQEVDSGDIIVCDFYLIKFIKFFQ